MFPRLKQAVPFYGPESLYGPIANPKPYKPSLSLGGGGGGFQGFRVQHENATQAPTTPTKQGICPKSQQGFPDGFRSSRV